MKRKVIILSLLLGVPGAMFITHLVLKPMNVAAKSVQDDQIAAELRMELSRIYSKRYSYPATLDGIWSDPEFMAILNTSFLPQDRSNAFTYVSTGDSYELTFTNGDKMVVERATRGAPSRDVVNVKAAVVKPASRQ